MSVKGLTGSVRLSADGAVGPSGEPIRVWSATWLSDSTARDLVLRNGTAATDTQYVQEPGVVSKTKTLNFAGGLRFPAGCFFDIGSATASVFEFEVEK